MLSKLGMRGGESGNTPASGTDVWVRWHRGSQWVFYALLFLTTLLALVFGEPSGGLRAAAIVVSLAFAGWHWFFQMSSPGWFFSHLGIRIAYVAGAIVFFVALVSMYPDYWLLSFAVFWQIWTIGSVWWSGAISLTLTIVLLASEGVPFTGAEGFLNLGLVFVAGTVSIVMGLYITSLISQSEERRRLIGELEEARKDLAAEERRAGVLEERSRLAREIHDTLAQGFISVVTHLEAAEEEEVSGEARRHLEQAKRTARENLVEARRLVAALRPEILESSSLPEALDRLARNRSEASGTAVEMNVTGDEVRLSQEIQVTLLRAAQEALSNARRHAGAKEVSMTLSYAGDLVLLDIADDGRGFDVEGSPNGGFGLRAMRERVESLGGWLLVESERGEGTTLAVQIPIGAEQTVEVE